MPDAVKRGHQLGFTLLHLMVGMALAAYALSVRLPIEARAAGAVAEVEAGMRALASAVRGHHVRNGTLPVAADLPAAVRAAVGFLPARHALGGDYGVTPHTAGFCIPGQTACPQVGWRDDGISIDACGVPAEWLGELKARMGGDAWIDRAPGAAAGCVRWELEPFGREAAHLNDRRNNAAARRVYADVGRFSACAPPTPSSRVPDRDDCPAPWRGDLEVEGADAPNVVRAALRADGRVEAAGAGVQGLATFGDARAIPPTDAVVTQGDLVLGPLTTAGGCTPQDIAAGRPCVGLDIVAGTVHIPSLCYINGNC